MKSALKKLIPKAWLRGYAELKNANKSAEEIFTEIYKKGYWGKTDDTKYFSGTGTHDENALKYVEVLTEFIRTNNIKSVFEIGCGDFSIMKQILQQVDVDYIGADIVAGLITYLQENHGNEQTNFIHFDAITAENYPDADLCVIRQVLQHLSNSQIQQILLKTKRIKYVIITEHVPVNPEVLNGDKSLGGYIRLQNAKTSGVFLDEAPFNLKCKTILSYAKNDEGFDGKTVPALMMTNLVVN
jgi:SAM-dependent methyltransferase